MLAEQTSRQSIAEREADKYRRIWQHEQYHDHSPGGTMCDYLLDEVFGVEFVHDHSYIDFGCGNMDLIGRLIERGAKPERVMGVDHVEPSNIPEGVTFMHGSLWGHDPMVEAWGTYGFCTDVMEHLPEQFTMVALDYMLKGCQELALSIAFTPDNMGALIGEPLHLTVRPFDWWRDSLAELGEIVSARDLGGSGVFHVE